MPSRLSPNQLRASPATAPSSASSVPPRGPVGRPDPHHGEQAERRQVVRVDPARQARPPSRSGRASPHPPGCCRCSRTCAADPVVVACFPVANAIAVAAMDFLASSHAEARCHRGLSTAPRCNSPLGRRPVAATSRHSGNAAFRCRTTWACAVGTESGSPGRHRTVPRVRESAFAAFSREANTALTTDFHLRKFIQFRARRLHPAGPARATRPFGRPRTCSSRLRSLARREHHGCNRRYMHENDPDALQRVR